MEDPVTPWVIAEATATGMSARWAWAVLILGAAFVLLGGILISGI